MPLSDGFGPSKPLKRAELAEAAQRCFSHCMDAHMETVMGVINIPPAWLSVTKHIHQEEGEQHSPAAAEPFWKSIEDHRSTLAKLMTL